MQKKIRLLLADDHQLVLKGLVALLEQEPEVEIAATAKNGQEAVEAVEAHSIDIAILDIDMPVRNGLDACEQIKKQFSTVKVLMLSMHHEPSLVQKAIEMGADGFVLKTADFEELIFALRQICKGKSYFDTGLFVGQNVDYQPVHSVSDQRLEQLTTREIEILSMIAAGLNNNKIAEKLFISPKTVDTHRTNLMRKLNANNAASLTRIAIETGLLRL